MNAIDLLKADHDRVDELFKQFKANEDGSHGKLFTQIRNELETHTHIEETIFYPACMKRGRAELKKIIREGLEEHAQVKDLLADLSKMTPRNKQFNAKLKVVVENVEHHVEEEEDEMFAMAEDQLSDTQLEKLGTEMEKAKTAFQKKHGIKPAPEPQSAVTSIIDKAKEVFGGLTGSTTKPQRSRSSNGRAKAAKANGNAISASAKTKNGSGSNGRSKTKTTRKASVSKGKTAPRSRSAASR